MSGSGNRKEGCGNMSESVDVLRKKNIIIAITTLFYLIPTGLAVAAYCNWPSTALPAWRWMVQMLQRTNSLSLPDTPNKLLVIAIAGIFGIPMGWNVFKEMWSVDTRGKSGSGDFSDIFFNMLLFFMKIALCIFFVALLSPLILICNIVLFIANSIEIATAEKSAAAEGDPEGPDTLQ